MSSSIMTILKLIAREQDISIYLHMILKRASRWRIKKWTTRDHIVSFDQHRLGANRPDFGIVPSWKEDPGDKQVYTMVPKKNLAAGKRIKLYSKVVSKQA